MSDITSRIDLITQEVIMTTRSLNAKELGMRPDETKWSIAEILDHIIVLNTSYFPIFKSLREGSYRPPFTGRFRFLAAFFGNFILKSVQPNEVRKTKTMKIWVPNTNIDATRIMDRFKTHQEEIKDYLVTLKDIVSPEVIINSPANRKIVYTFGTTIEIILSHEERHLQQIITISKSLKL